jgi:dihydrofolate synthase / folylpolyglutamate synthase
MTTEPANDSYASAIEFLYELTWFGAELGLEKTLKLADLAGNPHRQLRFIHVAGTNGKGSTCAILESIYRAAGLRVGLFTSPHLVSFRERIQVNRQLIGESDVARLVKELRRLLEKFPEGHRPTFFETITVMALQYFAERECDLVVWETGLGGRLDATNIVMPVASVITNIQYDHQNWLGETLSSIAAEKAGIIKPGIPVLTAAAEPETLLVIEKTANEQNAPLTKVEPASQLFAAGQTRDFPLLGEHQQTNAALAIATVQVLQKQFPVSEAALQTGVAGVNWAGRLQLVSRPSGQKILLDGAHNVAGAEALAGALKSGFPSAECTLVLGILRDKDWPRMCEVLAPLARRVIVVPVQNERTATASELAEVCKRTQPAAEVIAHASLSEALAETAGDSLVVIAGSLYLIGEAMELLKLSPATVRDERGLNEWINHKLTALPRKP